MVARVVKRWRAQGALEPVIPRSRHRPVISETS